jgi:ethanolamine utilization protein EutQ (cupin superfamily)
MVVRKNDTRVRKISDNNLAMNEIAADISENVSLAVLEVEDYDETETTKYNRIYYVFDGLLHLIINGKESLLQKGDAFFIERGMTFQMKGTFKAMSVNQPALQL